MSKWKMHPAGGAQMLADGEQIDVDVDGPFMIVRTQVGGGHNSQTSAAYIPLDILESVLREAGWTVTRNGGAE